MKKIKRGLLFTGISFVNIVIQVSYLILAIIVTVMGAGIFIKHYSWINESVSPFISFFGGGLIAILLTWGGVVFICYLLWLFIMNLAMIPVSLWKKYYEDSVFWIEREQNLEEDIKRKAVYRDTLEKERKEAENKYWKTYWTEYTKKLKEEGFNSSNNNRNGGRVAGSENEIQSSIVMFRLRDGFTKAELKKARNELMKAYHSDSTHNANDDEKVKEINRKYSLLMQMAK